MQIRLLTPQAAQTLVELENRATQIVAQVQGIPYSRVRGCENPEDASVREALMKEATVVASQLEGLEALKNAQTKIDQFMPTVNQILPLVPDLLKETTIEGLNILDGVIQGAIASPQVFGNINTLVATNRYGAYQAYVEAGFTQTEAFELVLAAASRPINLGSIPSGSSSKK